MRGIPSESLLIAGDGGHRAGALAYRVAAVATWTAVHRGEKDEVGGKRQRAGGARDHHLAVLQRLLQPLQRAGAELGQLVQEEHPPVGQADLAGARPVPAADQPGVADGVVGRAEGPVPDEGRIGGQHPGDAVDLGHL